MRMESADRWDSLSGIACGQWRRQGHNLIGNQLNIFTNHQTESVRTKFIDESNYLRFFQVIILP